MSRWWLCLFIASVVSADVAKFCGMMDVPFPLWIGLGLGSERNAVTFMFVRRDGPTRDSRFTTGVSVRPEGNHLAINSGNSAFQDTIRRVFRPIPVEAASIDLEYNEDHRVYYFRIMIGHEDRSVTLSQTYCKYAGMNGEFCGSTQRDSQKVTLVANIHAKEAQGSLRYITPTRQLNVEDTSFFLMRDGIVEFDINARPFGRFLDSMRHRDDCVRKLRGEYNSMTDRVHFWLTRTGGDPVAFVMDRFLCQYPVLGGLYDGIVMFVHVDPCAKI